MKELIERAVRLWQTLFELLNQQLAVQTLNNNRLHCLKGGPTFNFFQEK